MAVLVGVESVVLVLLVILVAGLLRSHADILRALHSLGARVGDPDAPDGASPVSSRVAEPVRAEPPRTGRGAPGRPAADVVGVSPSGEAVGIGVGGTDTLVAFLSSGCGTCAAFWQSLAAGAHRDLAPAQVLVVTRDPAEESTSALARLVPAGVRVVMSSAAWDDYAVPGSPYFVYVDGGARTVVGEGTASTWDQLVSLCSQARDDGRTGTLAAGSGRAGRFAADAEREARADRELMAAGIGPGHPSLHPVPTQADQE